MYWGKVRNDDEYNRIRARYGDTTESTAQIRALESLGLVARFTKNGTPADLSYQLRLGNPVATGWLHYGPAWRPMGGGHWTLLVGEKPTFYYHHDPYGEADLVGGGYINGWNGRYIKYSKRNWLPRWMAGGEAWMLTCGVKK